MTKHLYASRKLRGSLKGMNSLGLPNSTRRSSKAISRSSCTKISPFLFSTTEKPFAVAKTAKGFFSPEKRFLGLLKESGLLPQLKAQKVSLG